MTPKKLESFTWHLGIPATHVHSKCKFLRTWADGSLHFLRYEDFQVQPSPIILSDLKIVGFVGLHIDIIFISTTYMISTCINENSNYTNFQWEIFDSKVARNPQIYRWARTDTSLRQTCCTIHYTWGTSFCYRFHTHGMEYIFRKSDPKWR